MSFGKRAATTSSSVAEAPEAPSSARSIKWPLAACLAAGGLYAAYAGLGPKPFPSDGTVFEQCAYAVRVIGPSALASRCTVDTVAVQMVQGYRLWEKYGALDPKFPWLSTAEQRCNFAVGSASLITIEKYGVVFADNKKCAFEQDQNELVEMYFGFRKGMAKG